VCGNSKAQNTEKPKAEPKLPAPPFRDLLAERDRVVQRFGELAQQKLDLSNALSKVTQELSSLQARHQELDAKMTALMPKSEEAKPVEENVEQAA